ncbi:MAG: ATP-dependent metalloprotease, partial [Oceanospirillum sp.]|nr:ATP-dependent metalloprotease [Oceanospirillum sp.]
MVTKWGLSRELGPLMYNEDESHQFLGGPGGGGAGKFSSAEISSKLDKEVRSVIDECYDRAMQILTENRDKLDMMAEALMKYETIDAKQIDAIMEGREPDAPEGWVEKGHDAAAEAATEPKSESNVAPIRPVDEEEQKPADSASDDADQSGNDQDKPKE